MQRIVEFNTYFFLLFCLDDVEPVVAKAAEGREIAREIREFFVDYFGEEHVGGGEVFDAGAELVDHLAVAEEMVVPRFDAFDGSEAKRCAEVVELGDAVFGAFH